MTIQMDMEYINILMVQVFKEIGRMICNTDLEFKNFKMDRNIQDFIKTI